MNLAIKQRKSLIYIAPSKASFVMQDIKALESEFDLTSYFFSGTNKLLVPWELLKLFLFLLFRKKQVFLISFGGYHSFIATLVSRFKASKSYIILNGTDSVAIPEFGYGHLRRGLLKWCCKKSYEWTDKLLPVSSSLIETKNDYSLGGKDLGLKAVFPSLALDVQIIPNGFNIDFWKSSQVKDLKSIITVATSNRMTHKGIDLILEIAPKIPEYKISIAGISYIENCPSNIKLLGYLSAEELKNAYSKNKYYFQLSIWEGFGCALCEAILCGCVPVVSKVNMLPEIVRDERLVLKKRSSDSLLEKIHEIEKIQFEDEFFIDAIKTRFSLNNRIALLKEQISV